MQGLKETVQSVLQGYNATIMAYGQTVGGAAKLAAATCCRHWRAGSAAPTAVRCSPSWQWCLLLHAPAPALQGSGKTHTLLGDVGDAQQQGVVPRAVAELARGIAAYTEPCKFKAGAAVCGTGGCPT